MFMIVVSSAQLAHVECSLCIWQQPCEGVGVISLMGREYFKKFAQRLRAEKDGAHVRTQPF